MKKNCKYCNNATKIGSGYLCLSENCEPQFFKQADNLRKLVINLEKKAI